VNRSGRDVALWLAKGQAGYLPTAAGGFANTGRRGFGANRGAANLLLYLCRAVHCQGAVTLVTELVGFLKSSTKNVVGSFPDREELRHLSHCGS
jgi:hypothetical protein